MNSNTLHNGDRFPILHGKTADGEPISVPDDLNEEWSAVLFYRGHW